MLFYVSLLPTFPVFYTQNKSNTGLSVECFNGVSLPSSLNGLTNQPPVYSLNPMLRAHAVRKYHYYKDTPCALFVLFHDLLLNTDKVHVCRSTGIIKLTCKT